MDVKQLASMLFLGVSILSSLACQKKEEKPITIVDENNSQYAGKSCYGRSKENQYILTWSDGSTSLFRGSREQLEERILNPQIAERRVVFAEQDREISLNSLNLAMTAQESSPPTSQGIFWQVWGQEDIQANELWDKHIKGNGVIVAVIDAGVDQKHPALAGRIAVNEQEVDGNGIDDDHNGLTDDYKGFDFAYKEPYARPSTHGSHVAGIIAAEPKNSPMLGVAPETKILPLNIMGDQGGGSLSAAVFAIKYAQSRGAKIINASWGGAVCADTLKLMISSVAEQGVLFVAASGNEGVDIEIFPEFPASFGLGNQITVGATVPSGLMAAFSNYGRNRVHILAPGHQILSTVPGGWQLASGTSMAAPFVSGLAALLWGAHPEAKMEQIKSAILGSVRAPQAYNPVLAEGRINAPLALEKLEFILKQAEKPN